MKDNINVAELLKDCPKGMVLDCTMLDNVVFEKIDTGSPFHPIIIRRTDTNKTIHLTKYGQYSIDEDYKCVIFPKGKTTWEGFVPPCGFKDGDIITTLVKNSYVFYSIYKNIEDKKIMTYVDYCTNGDRIYNFNGVLCFVNQITEQRLSTEEEKQKLFDAIKENGYKWNEENKTLEKLVEPRFKVGDRIWCVCHHFQYDITELTDTHYTLVEVKGKFKYTEPICEDKNWELVTNKFDIITLKPFESRVLVRNSNGGFWQPTFWGIYEAEKANEHHYRNYLTTKGFFRHCIPYNDDTKHLLGTTDDCEDYYKTWE